MITCTAAYDYTGCVGTFDGTQKQAGQAGWMQHGVKEKLASYGPWAVCPNCWPEALARIGAVFCLNPSCGMKHEDCREHGCRSPASPASTKGGE